MLQIQEASPSKLLQTAVMTARQGGEDYVTIAHNKLLEHRLESTDITKFLNRFQWDAQLVNQVLITKSASADFALKLLEKKRFEEILCVNAGKVECDNEAFIVTLIAKAHCLSAPRAKRLTQQFEPYISSNGAICLLDNVGGDPNISHVLSTKLSM